MREILFRGRRRFNGEWVYGSLVHIGDFCAIIERDQDKLHPLDQMFLDANTGNLDGYATKVDPETIGQFTGMLDKYGNKIFEGDVVYNGHGYPGVVKWVYGMFGVCFSNGEYWDICQYVKEEYTKIIGNIHDNPELVKEGCDETC